MAQPGYPAEMKPLLEQRQRRHDEHLRRQHPDYLEPNPDDDPIEHGFDDACVGEPGDSGPLSLDKLFR